MSKKRVKYIILNVFIRMQKPYYQGVAAEMAFFFLMSMVPLFIIIAEIMGLFSLSVDIVGGFLAKYFSQDIANSLMNYFTYTSSGTISVLFLIFALWSASKAQYSMIRIANYTYTGLNSGRGFILERVRAMVTVVVTIFLLVFNLAVLVYGKIIANIAATYMESILLLPFRFNEVWFVLRWPAAVALCFIGVTFINYILPSRRLPIKKIIPGSIVTSTGIFTATWIYSFYMSKFSNYDLFYGSLASVVGLLIWFYILGYVMVIGIVFNAALMETCEDQTAALRF